MSNQLSNRIQWIDTAKGLGLLCVILGHLKIPYLSTWIYTFHMPLFFFLSGLVFSGGKYHVREFVIRRIKSLVLPYFTLGGVIFLFFCLIYLIRSEPIEAYGQMLRNFLVQEHFWTVWFLACLFLTEMLYYIIHRLCGSRPAVSSMVSVALCIFGFLRYRLGWGSLPWNLDVALIAQFFFHIGFLLRDWLIQWGRKPQSLFTSIAVLMGLLGVNAAAGFLCIRVSGVSLDMSIGMYGNEILTVISAVAGILFVVLLSQKMTYGFVTYLGRNTMVIFAWHSRIIIVLCDYIYDYFGVFQGDGLLSRCLYAITTFLLIFGILVPLTECIKKTKIHALFGI